MVNHLIHETSPYLLQHAHNPVNWYPWGAAAFAEAVRRDKPVLLSIGYSACHWCHVMEEESFNHAETAALMNAEFVCIKVDREERPDVDETYMAATQAMNHGRGGWPMTVLLHPDKAPFFAGTYFPPEDRYGTPSFRRVLAYFTDLWKQQRATLLKQAEALTEALQPEPVAASASDAGAVDALAARALAGWESNFDTVYGGFTPAPKFPAAATLMCMVQMWERAPQPGIEVMVRTTLDAMAAGGIRDHLGGGFARYSTDALWLVPHFEKMLYDNALLAQAYLKAGVGLGEARWLEVARDTLGFMVREMQSEAGGFFSAFDADSEGVEGRFYVWTPAEVAQVLQDPALTQMVCDWYDITDAGNWEGCSVLHTPHSPAAVAARHDLDPKVADERLKRARARLFEARRLRPAPHLDDKIITAWNGMAIAALAYGAKCLGDPAWLRAAARAADFALATLRRPDGRLWRTHRADKSHVLAYLEDYAFLGTGLLELYEAGGAPRFLQAALQVAEQMVTDFFDPQANTFFHTSGAHEALFGRRREGHDGATPSASATAAWLIGRLARHDADKTFWTGAAEAALQVDAPVMATAPQAYPTTLAARGWLRRPPVELAFVLPADAAEQNPWMHFKGLAKAALPPCAVAHGPADSHILLRQRPALRGACTLYLCREHTCAPPVTDDAEALTLI